MKEAIDYYLKKHRKSIKDILPDIEMTEAGYYAAIRNDSLKVSTLKKIAVALSEPIISFFKEKPEGIHKSFVEEPQIEYGNPALEIEMLRSKVGMLTEMNSILKDQVDLYKRMELKKVKK